MLVRLKQVLGRTWLYPRYIGVVYMRPAMWRAREFVRGRVVDIGCGQRPYQALYAERAAHYVGLDRPQFADRARPDVIADALRLPLPAGSADTVLATEVMEHLPDPGGFLVEVARVLADGGALILSAPFMEPLHEEPRDYYRFTPYSLRLLLERHGFSVAHIEAKGGWWSVTVGSFVNQALYDWANPMNDAGLRRDNPLVLLAILPVCALTQFLGYALDKVFKTTKYTLGYVAVATRAGRGGGG